MLSPNALIKGLVSRALPGGAFDGPEAERAARLSRYGDNYVISLIRKQHALVDEGSYFIANSAAAGIVGPVGTAFSATAAMMVFINNDSPSNALAKRLYLDYIRLEVITAGATGTNVIGTFFALIVDQTSRYTSGGTDITARIVNPNMDLNTKSVSQVVFGALTVPAATGAVRSICPRRLLRLPVVATTPPDIAGDRITINFGGVEEATPYVAGSTALLQANINKESHKVPAIVIGPSQTLLLHCWTEGASGTHGTGTTYVVEAGFWER